MSAIRVALIGLGNCASSLVQGVEFYRNRNAGSAVGLTHWSLGGYLVGDICVSAAFDVDERKVGRDVSEAIFSPPNCTQAIFPFVPQTGVTVRMGPILDGVSKEMASHAENRAFRISRVPEPSTQDVVSALQDARVDVVVNYLPVGSQHATEFYADCALQAGAAFINSIPVFIASDEKWARRFKERCLPLIGDDIKSQLGATITHRALVDLFAKRGVRLDRTYQLNTGGNTDFLNMLDRTRLKSKKLSKTEAVQAVAAERVVDDDIHVGPSDYVPWQLDNKISFIRLEGRIFGDVPINLELRLSVEDSPNSAGVAIDLIRCAKLALDQGTGGVLLGPSAYFCKHPPQQFRDDEAREMTERFLADADKRGCERGRKQ